MSGSCPDIKIASGVASDIQENIVETKFIE